MHKKIAIAIAFTVLAVLSGPRQLAAEQTSAAGLNGNVKHGKALYQRYCMYCHGEFGDGRGESAAYLNPKPRDFTRANFKCRSTPSGSLPLDQDLYDTISRGIHASGMPSWKRQGLFLPGSRCLRKEPDGRAPITRPSRSPFSR